MAVVDAVAGLQLRTGLRHACVAEHKSHSWAVGAARNEGFHENHLACILLALYEFHCVRACGEARERVFEGVADALSVYRDVSLSYFTFHEGALDGNCHGCKN